MSSLWMDLRFAVRMMGKAPGMTVVLIVTLALGIGATTTIFSVVSSVLLQPLPYDRPDRLMRVYTELSGLTGINRLGVTVPGFRDLRTDCRACAAVGAWQWTRVAIASTDRAVRVEAALASHELLEVLGVRPMLGRWYDESEDRPGDPQVVVIGHDLWQRVFAGDPNILGKQVHVDAVPVTVIGVMPAGFRFPERQELWLPARFDFAATGTATNFNLSAIARLADGASPAALREELAALALRWTDTLNTIGTSMGLRRFVVHCGASELLADLVSSLARMLWLLQAAVLFVLLIAVGNVASLLLARAEARSREIAVRHALGAGHGRLLRQLVTESLVLGLCGGAAGVLVAVWAIDSVRALIPREAPRAAEIALDGRSVAFAVVCAIAAALVFGLAPILHARRTDLHGALKDGSSRMTANRSRLRARRLLVVGEIALAVVLLLGCTVMIRSFVRLQQVELGFAPDHLLTFGIELPDKTYSPVEADAFWRRLGARMRALPGVRAAGLMAQRPPQHPKATTAVSFAGRTAGAPDEPDWITDFIQIMDSEAIAALGGRIVRGRDFAASDAPGAPNVALVNESFARRLFRGRDPIGQRVNLLYGGEPEFTVVGVVADVKGDGVDNPAGTELILPLSQFHAVWNQPMTASLMFAMLRTDGDPELLIPAVQRTLAELDPSLPVFELRSMDDVVWAAVARPRFLMFLLSAFAGVALVLAAVGIYGVMAHTIAQRTPEIGLRVALGAPPAVVRAMVLRQAAALVAAGVGMGLVIVVALAATLGPALRGVLYGEALVQPGLLVGVGLAVAVTALLATWIPVRRAMRIQPTVALRAE